MAANYTPAFDDLEPVETNEQDDDSDAEGLDLELGESIVGEVRAEWFVGREHDQRRVCN
jgi:hypothetical protein